MHINKAFMSVDDNPLYSDFWEPVSKVWNIRFGVEPNLIYFGNDTLSEEWGKVIKVTPVEGIPIHFQTQWARFWFTSQEEDSVCIVSDIDMFPISQYHFLEQLSNIGPEKYVHLTGNHRPLPVCYHAAKGSTFKKVLQLADTFEESCKQVWSTPLSLASHMGLERWGLDEAYTTQILESYGGDDLLLLSNSVGPRLDRSSWNYNYEEDLDLYVDAHSLRPYSNYRQTLDLLVTTLIS
tara:strand:+ start:8192 stop:8902 length:711 start_codon:yes stop_codon:yes gene_type:complete